MFGNCHVRYQEPVPVHGPGLKLRNEGARIVQDSQWKQAKNWFWGAT